jgi:sodium transport system permease protein
MTRATAPSSAFLAVFRKELTDTLRDRRTLIAMILVPLLLFPLLMIGTARITGSRAQEARDKQLTVAVADPRNDSGLVDHLADAPGITVLRVDDVSQLPARIASEELDAAIVLDPTFRKDVAALRPGGLTLMFKSSDDFDIPKRRVQAALTSFEQDLLALRFADLGLDPQVVHAVTVREHDIASTREILGKVIGGLLPYMFIIFCFTGSMYPAIDLAAGEKERGTLETLLTAPVRRRTLVLGKFAVVTLAGLVSAVIAVLSLYLSVSQGIEGIPPELLAAVAQVLQPATIATLLALLLPLSVFFAALLLMLSVYARSYKEAMSIISPLMIVVLFPAMIALLPGSELTPITALVPILNVSLATRALISGTADPTLIALVFASLAALAAVSLWACTRWFAREDIVFRS